MNFDDFARRPPQGASPYGRIQNREVHDRMSELAATPETEPTADDFVDIRVDEILIGSTLEHPLCDQTGVLLLAEGTTINGKVKEKLHLRKIHTVRVSPADARRISLDATAIGDRPTILLHAEIAKKLDSYLEQGILFVKSEGTALKEQMVVNGPKIFDKARRDAASGDLRIARFDDVALDDGSIAHVIRPNPDDLHAPTVQLVRNARGEDMPAADESVIELSVSERKVIQAIPTPGKNEVAFSPELLTGSAGGCAATR